jgi:cob(I)alamin adenosyltransferase
VSLAAADATLSVEVIPYINRLSDLLFTLARAVNRRSGRPETRWLPTSSGAGDTDAALPVEES